ncbi:hypothetical protein [Vibrio phage VCPH]|nr:hypothetical protein [Vibrio phage VCPH]
MSIQNLIATYNTNNEKLLAEVNEDIQAVEREIATREQLVSRTEAELVELRLAKTNLELMKTKVENLPE